MEGHRAQAFVAQFFALPGLTVIPGVIESAKFSGNPEFAGFSPGNIVEGNVTFDTEVLPLVRLGVGAEHCTHLANGPEMTVKPGNFYQFTGNVGHR